MFKRALHEWRPLLTIDKWLRMPMSSRVFWNKLRSKCFCFLIEKKNSYFDTRSEKSGCINSEIVSFPGENPRSRSHTIADIKRFMEWNLLLCITRSEDFSGETYNSTKKTLFSYQFPYPTWTLILMHIQYVAQNWHVAQKYAFNKNNLEFFANFFETWSF